MTSIQGEKAMADERMVVGAPATIVEEAYPGQDDTADNGAVTGKREKRVGKYRTKKGRRGVDSDNAESGAQPGTAFAAYLEVQADQKQRARAHWMEVTVQTYATGEIVHRALYNPTSTVHALKLVLQEALEFAPPVIDKDSGFEIPLRPGQVLRVGDIMHLDVPPEKRESFVTVCSDELDLDTCWWMSPLGHAAHLKIVLKKSTHKVINFGRVGRSLRAAPSSKAAAPPTNGTTADVPHHDYNDDNGSLAEGSLGPGASLSSQSTTFLEPSRSGTGASGAKKSNLTALTSPSRRRGNKASSSSSTAHAAGGASPSKKKAKNAVTNAAKPLTSSHEGMAGSAAEEPQSPMSPTSGAPARVKYYAGAEFNAAAVEKNRKRVLLYLERWKVDDDYRHALAFAKHALANHHHRKTKCREEGKEEEGKRRNEAEDEDDDEGEGDIPLESLSLTLPLLHKQQQQQPRLASWKRSEWNKEAMNGSWSVPAGPSRSSSLLRTSSSFSSSPYSNGDSKPKTAGQQQQAAQEAAQRKRDKRHARELNEERQSRLYDNVQSWEGARWVEQRLEKINLARCVPSLRGRFEAFPPLACLTSLRRLNLASNCLSGPLPALSLARLHELQQLNLQGNQLSGELPATLTHLTALTELNLSKNHFTGPVPPAWGGGWHLNLGVLNLSHNRLDGALPDELGGLRKLRVLNLSRNCFTGWLHSWVGWLGANLQQLTLNHNKFVGSLPEALGRLHHLEYFHVQHNRFEGILTVSMFAAMSPSLREVHFQSNQFFAELTATTVSDDPDELTRAEKLLDIKCEIEDMFEHCSVLA